MTLQSQSDLELSIASLEIRRNALIDEIKVFLEATGAPTLQEAAVRFKRFAQIAIDLPTKLDDAKRHLTAADKRIEDLVSKIDKARLDAGATRQEITTLKSKVTIQHNWLKASKAAMQIALDVFDTPMFSGFRAETKDATAALRAVIDKGE